MKPISPVRKPVSLLKNVQYEIRHWFCHENKLEKAGVKGVEGVCKE
jgi:hypothetical protein